MIDNCYTFEELKNKFNWDKNTWSIPQQINYAKTNGVEIEPAFKKGRTYFKIVDEFHVYTLDDLIKEFNLSNYLKVAPPKERDNYLKTRGLEVEICCKKGTKNLYKILKNDINKIFTWDELCKKYNFLDRNAVSILRVQQANKNGLIIEQTGVSNKVAYYKVINDNIYQWDSFPDFPNLEFCKKGFIRNRKSKKIYNGINSYGYVQINYEGELLLAHRLLMLMYNPIENANFYIVDHINGIRNDNRIENLRWVSEKDNTFYRTENRKKINDCLNQIIQKVGYEKTIEILEEKLKIL